MRPDAQNLGRGGDPLQALGDHAADGRRVAASGSVANAGIRSRGSASPARQAGADLAALSSLRDGGNCQSRGSCFLAPAMPLAPSRQSGRSQPPASSDSACRALGIARRIGSPLSLRSMLPESGHLPSPQMTSSLRRESPLPRGVEPRLPEWNVRATTPDHVLPRADCSKNRLLRFQHACVPNRRSSLLPLRRIDTQTAIPEAALATNQGAHSKEIRDLPPQFETLPPCRAAPVGRPGQTETLPGQDEAAPWMLGRLPDMP